MNHHLYCYGEKFCALEYSAGIAIHTEYEECVFQQCSFEGVDLSDIKFITCHFEACNFTGAIIHETIFRDVVFNGCKLLGLEFSRCNEYGFSAEFRECNVELADYSRRNMKKARFEGCRLHNADFTGADLKESVFINCDLASARFENSNLEKVDFTGSCNLTIDPSMNKLKGARIPMTELPGLLYMYNLEVV